MPIPQSIQREHIVMALEALHRKRDIPAASESSKYDLHFKDKRYPVKYVIRLAYKFVDPSGQILPPFKGARMARSFLRNRDFQIFNKSGALVDD